MRGDLRTVGLLVHFFGLDWTFARGVEQNMEKNGQRRGAEVGHFIRASFMYDPYTFSNQVLTRGLIRCGNFWCSPVLAAGGLDRHDLCRVMLSLHQLSLPLLLIRVICCTIS